MINTIKIKFYKLFLYVVGYTLYVFLINKRYKIKKRNNNNSIIYINTFDIGGGAAKISYELLTNINNSILLVDKKKSLLHNVKQIIRIESKKQKILLDAQKYLQWQDFFYLDSLNEIQNHIQKFDIIHLHNLHSWEGYFSPFILPEIALEKFVVWTLHDMHAVTGHCGYSFECEKWIIGCGNCPHLEVYPKLTKDTTSFIWNTKRRIYQKCNMHIVVPSKWLYNIVTQSILSHLPCTLIYNGIDTNIFTPNNKQNVREKFGLPQEKTIILFSADLGVSNPFKGGEYILKLIDIYSNAPNLLFINIGGGQSIEKTNHVWNIPYVQTELEMAQWYSTADIYIYPSLADNCPLVILEAMACGLPIVTFNTGGIPELVLHESTGYVAAYKDFEDLKLGIDLLIHNSNICNQYSINSINRVKNYFTKEIMIQNYLRLYNSL